MPTASPAAVPITSAARLLGFGGLLPQLGALLLVATGADASLGALMALAYAVLILSFLGGVWWGYAMRRTQGQAELAALATLPTLFGVLVVFLRLFGLPIGWALVAIGSGLMLTLLIDRKLTQDGEAPASWLGLRVPLSLGLGVLTILTGILSPDGVTLIYSN